MDIELILKNKIKMCLSLDIPVEEIEIEVPKNKEYGDFSSNIAMKLCKKLGKNPFDIACSIKDNIKDDLIEKVEVVKPGFINFFVDKTYLLDNIINIIKKDKDYGRNNIGNNKKINVEFVSVNPTGSIHLGHTRGACYGDSLCNILAFSGYDVTREYYINDAGGQMDNMAKSILERYKEVCGLEFKMEDNFYYGEDIKNIAIDLYNEYGDKLLNEDIEFFKKKGLSVFLGKIKKDLEDIDVKFDIWSSEKAIREKGLVEESLKKLENLGYTYNLDGAVYLKTSLFGDEKDRVIKKTDGSYTYFAPDIAYHMDKLNRGYDKLIDVLGSDHHGYVARLKAAVTMLGQDSNKLDVFLIQMVRAIKDGAEYKLSKRTGKSITLKDLVDDTSKDAVRYFFTSRSIDTMMDYDVDLALKKNNENPVYYVNYAHARICSILKDHEVKAEDGYKFETINSDSAYNVLVKLKEFEKVVEKSARNYEPHLITNYVYELASLFHSYYAKEKIVTDDVKYTNERLMLCKAVKITIYNALNLIGIKSPERM